MYKEIIYVEEHPFTKGKIAGCPYAYTNSEIIMNIAKMFGTTECVRNHLGNKDSDEMCYANHTEWNPFIEVLDRTGIEYEFIFKSASWFENELSILKSQGQI